jgi:Sigma-70 region 2
MDDQQWLSERFEEHRTRLRAVAYRMLCSISEADDAVQEAWLRLSRSDTSEVENLGAWLTTVVGRVCLNMLRSRTSRREEPLEESPVVRVPDPIVGRADGSDPEQEALRRLVRRFGRYFLVGERDLDRMLGHFERHGGTTVLVGDADLQIPRLHHRRLRRLEPGAHRARVGPGYQVAPRLGARFDAPVRGGRGDGRGRALVPLEDRQTTRNRRNARRSRPASLREDPVVVEVRPRSGSATGRFDRHVGKMASLPLRAVDAAP